MFNTNSVEHQQSKFTHGMRYSACTLQSLVSRERVLHWVFGLQEDAHYQEDLKLQHTAVGGWHRGIRCGRAGPDFLYPKRANHNSCLCSCNRGTGRAVW